MPRLIWSPSARTLIVSTTSSVPLRSTAMSLKKRMIPLLGRCPARQEQRQRGEHHRQQPNHGQAPVPNRTFGADWIAASASS
jgi:hypothetical protein